MQNKLYIGNLSFNVSQGDLEAAFGEYGAVRSVNIITDRDTGRPRGFAFLEMSSDAEAQAAIKGLDGTSLDGRQINVSVAKPRERSGGFGGHSRGR